MYFSHRIQKHVNENWSTMSLLIKYETYFTIRTSKCFERRPNLGDIGGYLAFFGDAEPTLIDYRLFNAFCFANMKNVANTESYSIMPISISRETYFNVTKSKILQERVREPRHRTRLRGGRHDEERGN